MNELRRLTWKYFFKQKWEEIKDYLWITIPISMFISIFGFVPIIPDGKPLPILAYIGLSILILWGIFGIWLLIKSFIEWLKSNWQEAEQKAEQELNSGVPNPYHD